jgi:hypothetical protein
LQGLSPGALDYLVGEISHGRRVSDEILNFTNAGPRIINDAKAARLLRRDAQRDDGAMPDMDPAELATRRRYVWNDAPFPLSRPQPRGEHGADNSSSWLTPYAKVCARLGCPRSKRKRVLRENLDFIDWVERPKRS